MRCGQPQPMTKAGKLATWSPMTRANSGGDRKRFLRANRDISYVKQHGRRLSTTAFNLLICRTEGNCTRVGIVVGKRFGTAVRRNRAKRLFRELTRLVHGRLVEGYSLLVFPKRDAIALPFHSLKQGWCSALRRQGVLQTDER